MDNKNNRLFYWEVKNLMQRKPQEFQAKKDSLKDSINTILNENKLYRQNNFNPDTESTESVSKYIKSLGAAEAKNNPSHVAFGKNSTVNPFNLSEQGIPNLLERPKKNSAPELISNPNESDEEEVKPGAFSPKPSFAPRTPGVDVEGPPSPAPARINSVTTSQLPSNIRTTQYSAFSQPQPNLYGTPPSPSVGVAPTGTSVVSQTPDSSKSNLLNQSDLKVSPVSVSKSTETQTQPAGDKNIKPGAFSPKPAYAPRTPGVDVEGPPSPSPTMTPQPTATPTKPASGVTPAVPPAKQPSREEFQAAREAYYTKQQQAKKTEAEERLARMGQIDMSKQSAHGRAEIAVQRMRAEKAARGEGALSQQEISRQAASDTAEQFMSPEEKAARAARIKQGSAALEAEAHAKYGPGPLVKDISGERKISGTSMTYDQFQQKYGKPYNALSAEDANLVRGAASTFAVGRVAPSAQQAMQTATEFNRIYGQEAQRNIEKTGQLDRSIQQQQAELERIRRDPEYRAQLRQQEISRIQSQPGFVQNIARQMR